jgi:hypothetical protein
LQEVKEVIKKLRSKKAPGEDPITGELIKYGGEHLYRILYTLIKQIWETEKMPVDCSTAMFCPIYKKGDKTEYKSYREFLC